MHLLIPAAGRGSRMGADGNKLLLPLLGRPLLAWTLAAAAQAPSTGWIGIVGQPIDEEAIRLLVERLGLRVPVHWIEGGETRQQSVYQGLLALPAEAQQVLIHDGARCLASPALFERCGAALAEFSAIVAAVPVKDTIKQVYPHSHRVEKTIARERLWAAQTPQGGKVGTLKAAHAWAAAQAVAVTDDAALCELRGEPVQVVLGEQTNLKITTPADLFVAEAILKTQLRQDPSP
ncbi:MAG: 2-C-methyl-D-erythritol 4-phosphate cytidylyltransferase [Aphanocapsa lilacina HA4352-LM1]|jgi:2-C-methyl-D-erythritol 4-phosphate cytidylyltransferase|nr:2-C-methyl-D-erythritol 4-phosphate cytidylyltransferase [Aphanocapsa lilacina HA4352-LM1]